MAFRLFHEFFPELAEKETRTITVLSRAYLGVPAGEYGLLEMFCDEPGCDCRRVLFSVISPASERVHAVVAWGWEDVGFYARWIKQGSREDAKYLKGPILNMGSPAADYAPTILAFVREMLDHDPMFVERIKRHYALFRGIVEAGNAATCGEPAEECSDETDSTSLPRVHHAYCIFCGSTVGQESDRTGGTVTAVYDCPKCRRNYCSECSYAKDGSQYCLRCDSILAQVEPRDDAPSLDYEAPVSRLLSMGAPGQPMEYAALGIAQEHVPALIRMATDPNLHQAFSESDEVWAPLHAWRALGQLRAPAAIEPLVGLLRLVDEEQDDWVGEDLPEVLSEFGAPAISALAAFLEDTSRGLWGRIAASAGLAKIAERHPKARDACVVVLTNQLKRFARNGQDLNGSLVSDLVDLGAVESVMTIERAFAANAVDLSVLGDWEDVQIELGLLDKRITPRRHWGWLGPRMSVPRIKAQQVLGKPCAKAKKKRKDQKASRKKNRRK
jgi:hypothetical protein